MVPDLRPSSPFNSGPTLFLAPSPIAWQARHLLNEVLPAAASCASAPGAAANEVTTTSALKVDVFMWGSSFLPGREADFLWQARLDWTSRKTMTGFIIADLSQREPMV